MNVIETHGLTKVYGGRRAVDALEMSVAQGDIYGFVGKNGAGKSTTMKMFADLVIPTSGEAVLFRGMPHEKRISAEHRSLRELLSSEPSHIGALIETPGLVPGLSALENMMTKAISMGVVRARTQCGELLDLVGLDAADGRRVKGYSMGMKQRLGVALALVGSPDLLLLDEPFNGMDPEATRDLRGALARLNEERGVSMVISSHVLDQLNRMATRFGVIRDGSMVKEFSTEQLHASCGSSILVKTADPARALVVLEERLPDATIHVEPDQAIVISTAIHAQTPGSYERGAIGRGDGRGVQTAAAASPGVEEVSRILHDADQTVLELSRRERDIEDYFVELMGGTGPESRTKG
ncbi:ABC transporter related protein [Coriobacterium glomerans PW2]|uniref:ABC transporter related protein n=1 Tax=Coriobacterium glomerans (strain ATCC 49209 / DSM 20642 / JCM 10262 / PW2) TaxID=700015 RepID=F2N744_CORGP|nr:ATP-binding cassette domain-containing protein [Coriobacterium glomerans]AEB06383.1 ABC transporter related protein [Coriobacterium glomerans PW2]